MKVLWSRIGLIVLGIAASLFLTQGAVSAIHTDTNTPASAWAFLGSILLTLKSANEPSLLLILGAFLIVVGIRIRQMSAAKNDL